MKRIDKKTGIRILFLVILLGLQCSQIFGQNVIQLHKKDGKHKDYIVKTGRRARINTYYMQTINGKIKEIKDSSIIIGRKAKEVPIKNIRYFYCQKIVVGDIIGATFSSANIFGVFEIVYLTSYMPGLALELAAFLLPAPSVVLCFFLTNKKRFDIQSKYDLNIVKPK
jgi:hypothetical protein